MTKFYNIQIRNYKLTLIANIYVDYMGLAWLACPLPKYALSLKVALSGGFVSSQETK